MVEKMAKSGLFVILFQKTGQNIISKSTYEKELKNE